jgi:cytochrome c peroxidase
MKTATFILIAFLSLLVNCTQSKKPHGAAVVFGWADAELAQVEQLLNLLDTSIQKDDPLPTLRRNFFEARHRYKRIELLTEYYFQGLLKRINGPALPDIKVEDGQVWPPHGFQVIEQALFTDAIDTNTSNIRNEIQLLLTDLRFVRYNLPIQPLLDRHAQELLQHQLIRIVAFGLTGFDSPLALNSISEAKHALEGVRLFSEHYYQDVNEITKIGQLITDAQQYLGKHKNFDQFDRLAFLKGYLFPISIQIASFHKPAVDDLQFIKPFEGGMVDWASGRFNSSFFVNYANGTPNPYKDSLGKRLFYETRLSKSKKISCGSCHQPALYFTDGKQKATNFLHGGSLPRNTPSLYYASLQAAQFYDLRSVTLEDQINEVMHNENEFDLSPVAVAAMLKEDTSYRSAFQQAFSRTDSMGSYEVRNALASYVRTLSPFSSLFDQYIRDEITQYPAPAIRGFNIFMGKAKCGTCHFFPIFNGTLPPWYSKSESEIIGVPSTTAWKNARIDPDRGRYEINKMNELLYAFKTPTVRNTAITAPYMHNGVYKSLNEVILFYQRGGGTGIGITLPNQSLPFDTLVLSADDKDALLAFLNTLSDK